MVPYVSTSGVRIELVTEQSAVATIKNRRKIRNHVGGVHAAAVGLLAETISGVIVARNIPDTALPLIKTMKLNFVKRNYGDFRGEATLTAEQIEQIRTEPRGTTVVPVTLTDAKGNESVTCEMVWAWVPKKKS
jgi:acyl-coenzyme A thioesterase PaaI-like protein